MAEFILSPSLNNGADSEPGENSYFKSLMENMTEASEMVENVGVKFDIGSLAEDEPIITLSGSLEDLKSIIDFFNYLPETAGKFSVIDITEDEDNFSLDDEEHETSNQSWEEECDNLAVTAFSKGRVPHAYIPDENLPLKVELLGSSATMLIPPALED